MIAQPLTRRIVIAFTLMTLVVSGLFSISIIGVMLFTEEHLVSQTLDRELNGLLYNLIEEDPDDIAAIRVPYGSAFYTSQIGGIPIPEKFHNMDIGFSEIVDGNEAFYAYKKEFNGNHYILIQDQDEFEAHENAMKTIVFISFLASVFIAWVLGLFVARKAISPVILLSKQVKQKAAYGASSENLAPDYPKDEVGDLAAAFDGAMDAVVQSLWREQLFTSDVSHELRTPLMIIGSSCELLKKSSLTKSQGGHIERISSAAEDMSGLVKTFLILARSDLGELDANSAKTLNEVAEDQYKYWLPLMKKEGLIFNLEKSDIQLEIYNETLLSTVIRNLLRNALHYTETGEIKLVVGPNSFYVKDTGIGIAENEKGNIFDAFFRGSAAHGHGLGLGLSLVQRICTRQNWLVSVEQNPNKGSTFKIIMNA